MPELPEVEVVRRGLAPVIVTRYFASPILYFPDALRYPSPELFSRSLAGRRVEAVERKGKFLMILLDKGELAVHLRMTGRLVYAEKGLPPEKHLRAVLPFDDGTALYFIDLRRFGGLWLLESAAERARAGLDRLGPDIYNEVDPQRFLALLQSRPRARIKPLLLDQRFLAGLGNIYVDESLHRSRIHPLREVASLSREEILELYRSLRAVLEEGIDAGGTSFRDYVNARGEPGAYQRRLAVYGRKNLPCRCGGTVQRIVVAGRGTYICPRCQPSPRL